jgi:hypothetical protein
LHLFNSKLPRHVSFPLAAGFAGRHTGLAMSPRRNYGFERWQRETVRRTRQEAKRERKAERSGQGEGGPEMGSAPETGTPAGQWEWFSPSRGRVAVTAAQQRPVGDAPDDWVLLTEGVEETEPPGPAS